MTRASVVQVDPLKLLSAPSYVRGPGPGAYGASNTFGRTALADPACSAFSSTEVRRAPHRSYCFPYPAPCSATSAAETVGRSGCNALKNAPPAVHARRGHAALLQAHAARLALLSVSATASLRGRVL